VYGRLACPILEDNQNVL